MAKFTVDTHLFRELGELLVGRDSTALVELIKNAYDADASSVVIYGEALADTDRGFIQITDDGIGMTRRVFEDGFLRIASRTKDQGSRVSRRYHRRFTGSKGIGRLAAHKLARFMEVHSVPWEPAARDGERAVDASIDWDIIESYQTLDELANTGAIRVEASAVRARTTSGTVIVLRRLRRRWTTAELGRFLIEAQTSTPPSVLIHLPKALIETESLFDTPLVRDAASEDPGFRIELEGEFTPGEDYWQNIALSSDWVVEIDALDRAGRVVYLITPTKRTRQENPEARVQRFPIERTDGESGPFFQARILVRQGASAPNIGRWAERASGLRVFMEGFRVLPYGEPTNDWLGLDADYRRRSRSLASLQGVAVEGSPIENGKSKDWALSILGNNSYFGAVFLTQANAVGLRMLVNREGFVPDRAMDALTDLVRKGIDLSTRVRALTRYAKDARSEQDQTKNVGLIPGRIPTKAQNLSMGEVLSRAKTLASEARQMIAAGDIEMAATKVSEATSQVEMVTAFEESRISERAMLGVLASVGTQMASFIHEIHSLMGMAEAVDATLARIRRDSSLPRSVANQLAQLQSDIGTLRRSLERQASYLLDIVTPDSRRRRIRQSLSERFDTGVRLVRHLADQRGIEILNDVPREANSPPMFPAELTVVFSNLLTNAVKAAGIGGRIHARAEMNENKTVTLVIENSGVAVDPVDGERLFRPFESSTTEVDPVLGQGMGLGLPITRNLLAEYGATIGFVQPSPGYATALQVVFPA